MQSSHSFFFQVETFSSFPWESRRRQLSFCYLLSHLKLQKNLFCATISIMSSASPIVLILGAGPRIGSSVAKIFAAKGYKVALASRKKPEANHIANEFHVQSDFADPDSVTKVFSHVKASLGVPSVVVYNSGHPCLKSSCFCSRALGRRRQHLQPSQ